MPNSQTSKWKRLQIKIFPCKLYPFNIDVCFKHQNTSCTLLKIVYIFELGIFLNNIIIYKFIFICMVKEKTNGIMISICKYPQWILTWLKNFMFYYECEFFFMVFHKANKLSSNITWVHSRTLNVIHYFQNIASHGRATCLTLSTPLVLSHTYSPSLLFSIMLPHTPLFPLSTLIINSPIISLSFDLPFFFYLGTTSTFPFYVFLPYLSSHTHTLSLSPSFYPFSLFFMLPHTPLSQTQKGPKKKKKKTWSVWRSYCQKKIKKTFGRQALEGIAPWITGKKKKKKTLR